MRMWMVDPRGMCRKHLLGEHVECHMIAGSLAKGRRLDGFVDKNCLHFSKLHVRHNRLAKEMLRRGYNHLSPLRVIWDVNISRKVIGSKVDRAATREELQRRCLECRNMGK